MSSNTLLTQEFNLPDEYVTGIWKKAQSGSVLSKLSGARPQRFGKSDVMTLTSAPRAEIVAESGQKSPTPTHYAPKTVSPIKLQVTVRASQEVMWADEDYQIGVMEDIQENCGIALARALDLVGIHKINPLTGTVSDKVTDGIVDATSSVTIAEGKYDEAIESAAGLVIANGYAPTGVALDPALAFGLATMRDKQGRKLYPELGLGQSIAGFNGMTAAVGDTVSAKQEATAATNIFGIVGQFDAFRWGIQRQIACKVIEYGDPDGLGDLQRLNQIAIRAEVVYGIGVMDEKAFAKIVKAA